MLHIVLAILKIIGIILAAVLLLLLLALLAVLFIPLRYQITLRKEGDILYGQGKASYFLHIITVLAEYKEGKPDFWVKIFGIRLGNRKTKSRRTEPKKKDASGKGGTSDGENSPDEVKKSAHRESDHGKPHHGEPAHGESDHGKPAHGASDLGEPAHGESDFGEPHHGESDRGESAAPGQGGEIDTLPGRDAGQDGAKPVGGEDACPEDDIEEKKDGIFARIASIWRGILKFIGGIISFIKSIPDILRRAAGKISHIGGQIRKYREILKAEETKALLGNSWKEVRYLLRHFKPRHAKGYIRFGTGDPASTGQILGIACIFLPIYSCKIQVYPDFDKSIYEGFLVISGHIRLCHLLKSGWKLYKDKNTRKFIKRIRQ